MSRSFSITSSYLIHCGHGKHRFKEHSAARWKAYEAYFTFASIFYLQTKRHQTFYSPLIHTSCCLVPDSIKAISFSKENERRRGKIGISTQRQIGFLSIDAVCARHFSEVETPLLSQIKACSMHWTWVLDPFLQREPSLSLLDYEAQLILSTV